MQKAWSASGDRMQRRRDRGRRVQEERQVKDGRVTSEKRDEQQHASRMIVHTGTRETVTRHNLRELENEGRDQTVSVGVRIESSKGGRTGCCTHCMRAQRTPVVVYPPDKRRRRVIQAHPSSH